MGNGTSPQSRIKYGFFELVPKDAAGMWYLRLRPNYGCRSVR